MTKTDLAAVFNKSGFQPWKMIKMENHFRKWQSGPTSVTWSCKHSCWRSHCCYSVSYLWYYCWFNIWSLCASIMSISNKHTGSLDSFFLLAVKNFGKTLLLCKHLTLKHQQCTSWPQIRSVHRLCLNSFTIYYSSKSAAERIKAFKHVMNDLIITPQTILIIDRSVASVLSFKHMKLY